MSTQTIGLKESGQVSELILDYTQKKETLNTFYEKENSINGFGEKISSISFSKEKRALLVQQLQHQYKKNNLPTPTNLEELLDENTFVVTTGHQLGLFGGPQYFIHKIVSIIKLAQQLNSRFPEKNVIPIFWLASEDHDFEEINHTKVYRSELKEETELKGAVGRMPNSIFESAYQELYTVLGNQAEAVKALFEPRSNEDTLTANTTKWVNRIFKDQGLLIIDGDDVELKRSFIPTFKKELETEQSFELINTTSASLEQLGYKAQVTPREINLFYLKDNLRERIILENGNYTVLSTNISFTKEEIFIELEDHPERFSPNAVFRPVYQEAILPNLAYVGGPGELAYWLQLKRNFNRLEIPYPILVLRDLFLTIDQKSLKTINELNLQLEDFFLDEADLIKTYLANNETTQVDFETEKKQLETLKETTLIKAIAIDASLKGMIEAEFTKMQKGLDNINKKTQRSIKQREEVSINKLKKIQEKINPNGRLAERSENFIPNYLKNPANYISNLIENSDVFNPAIKVIEQ